MRRTKIQKKGKTKPFSMIDIVTKEDRNHIRSPTSYIYIYIFPRETLPLAIYFNVNKRIPKEWSGLVILDFSNSSPLATLKGSGKEHTYPSNSRCGGNRAFLCSSHVFCFTENT